MKKERVGFALCGSFCTHAAVLPVLEKMTEQYETVVPIVSDYAAFTDTRFGTSEDFFFFRCNIHMLRRNIFPLRQARRCDLLPCKTP